MADETKPEVAIDDVQDKGIEVDLDKPSDSPAPVSSEPKYVTLDDLNKIQKQLNGLSYIGRQFQEVSRKLDGLKPQEAPRPQGDRDPYDEMVEKDWKLAVRQLAREEAEAKLREDKEQVARQSMEQSKLNLLDESKKKVLSKYPELDDPNSEISRKYVEVLNRNQDYLRNDRGPILAMRDMEEELRSEGRLDEGTRKVVEKEINRQVRTGAAVLPRSSNGNTGNKVMLTREEKELCDTNNIRYENYASMKKKQESSGRQGVEV